jgi:hypothetical protein
MAHVRVASFPVELSFEVPDGVGDGVVEDVDDLGARASNVNHVRADGSDPKNTLVRRLASAAGVEGGPVQDHLPTGEPHHPGLELLEVGVPQEELLGHSARVPRSRFLKVTTSR